MQPRRLRLRLAAAIGCALLAPTGVSAVPIVFSATGAAAGDIQAQVDAFRVALGDPNNGNAPGPLASGRREINWDGGGATEPSVVGTPFTGFENIRGATMTTPGTGFIQGDPAALATQFANAGYADDFAAFSPLRLFAPTGSNVTDVTFSIPGTDGAVPATVSAFGAVFSDVNASDSTTIQFFTTGDTPVGGPFAVPAVSGDATFSFLGVLFDEGAVVTRVRITTGNTALGPSDVPGEIDVAAMDDFLYSEPVPEPGTLLLVALGLSGLTAGGRRRRT